MKKKVCFIGQPNVGKSTLFNYLTKSHQHTGNWTGKTVEITSGTFNYKDTTWEAIDLPGTYSLIGESIEEEITSTYVSKKEYDKAVVVIDATNLERGLVLLLEVLEVTENVVVCLNLYDEVKKQNLKIDILALEKEVGVPVIFTSAKEKEGISKLLEKLNEENNNKLKKMIFNSKIEEYISFISPKLNGDRHKCLELLTNDTEFNNITEKTLKNQISFFRKYIKRTEIKECFIKKGMEISKKVIIRDNLNKNKLHEKIDHLLTNKWSGITFMILLLFFLLWITISVSNVPSDWLFSFFSFLEPKIYHFLSFLPKFIVDPLVYGGYRTLYWVVSVMTPPMAIFFPLFSLLEDYGLLPKIAFNLDKPFRKCGSCGKQSLTMCMGIGCNAVGVTGTRIMENKKMRILSILTNVFMPCNGRFPTMISILSMFFILSSGLFSSIVSSLLLTLIIVFGILLTFLVTKICNYFLFKDEKTIFVLELPDYRRPKFFKTIFYSLKTKALDVLKRAIVISFPAGLIIYFLANTYIGTESILVLIANFIQPFGKLIGLDGFILLAFLLGLPANEIVIPILLLGYSSTGVLTNYESLEVLKNTFVMHGWTTLTAINFLILCLCHFPCATTLLTIKKETNSLKLTFLSFILPTVVGIILCFIVATLFG